MLSIAIAAELYQRIGSKIMKEKINIWDDKDYTLILLKRSILRY